MTSIISKEIRLKSRPSGMPILDNFEVAQVELSPIKEGQFLVKNLFMSVDPYMRGRMNNVVTYIEPFKVGEPLSGDAVGVVVSSKNEKFKEGYYVTNSLGFREYFISDGSYVEKFIPAEGIDISAYIGVLGMPGFTAYVGLNRIGKIKEKDRVFVSSAAGAVGSTVCQIAKLKSCYVAGSAGSDEKVNWLVSEAKIDAAFNYKEVKNLDRKLKELFPDGIDIYYENVGGKHLEAALNNMNKAGRIVLCGMISQYNLTSPESGPYNLFMAIVNRLRIEGFIVFDHSDLKPQFYKDMEAWIKTGKIKWEQTVVEGIENTPAAFIGLFKGKNKGKMVVKL